MVTQQGRDPNSIQDRRSRMTPGDQLQTNRTNDRQTDRTDS
jgi:hypothetical protein